MRHVSVRAAVCLAAACFTLSAAAHQEGEIGADLDALACKHPPADAVGRLPDLLQPLAQLTCAPSGQLIVAHEDWVWRYPASYFTVPLIAAYSPIESRAETGPRYFTALAVEELTAEAGKRQNEALGKALPNYRTEPPPARVLRMVATNELGHRFEVYFPMTDANNGWGAICAPDCAPEMLFMIYRKQ